MKKEISIIIPAFNRTELLKRAAESVLSQSYQNFELIVVDDGSDDDIGKLISSLKNDIIYIKQKNKGPAAARNTGIKASRTKLLAFLDSDDWWDKEKLSTQINKMNKNPSYLISHTQEIWYKNGKLLNQKKRHKKFHGYIFDKCLPLCVVSMSTVIVRKELFDIVGLFDENLPCCEDYDFWLRTSINHPLLLIDKPLTLKEGGRKDQVSYIYRTGMDKYRIKAITKILDMPGLLSDEQKELTRQELIRKCHIYGNGCIKHGKVKEGNYYLSLPVKMATRLTLFYRLLCR